MSVDAFEIVRAWFAAFNRGDAGAVAALYAEDAAFDGDEGLAEGRTAILAAVASHIAAWQAALDNGARRRVRTMGRIESGISTEWVARERRGDSGELVESTGYAHFDVREGLIVHHREVSRPLDRAAPASMLDPPPPSRRQYPDRPVVGVGAVVIEHGRVLLVKRRFEPLAGQWSLPGGSLELGETLEAGVAREILEETGLQVEVGPVVEVFDRILLDPDDRVRYHFVLIDYLCRPVGGRLQAGSDVADAAFVEPDAVSGYRMTPKAVAVVERALAMSSHAWDVPGRPSLH
jgi:ADP-ribose pyrophosphatase YjhB (NUDIX family)